MANIDVAVEHKIALLADGHSDLVKRAAAASFRRSSDREAVVPLIEALKDPNIADAAASALGRIGDQRAVEPLGALLRNRDPKLRTSVLRALESIKDPRAFALATAMLEDQEAEVRTRAIRTLEALGDRRSCERLAARLLDPNSCVRAAAANALTSLAWEPDTGAQRAAYAAAREGFDAAIAEGAAAWTPLATVVADRGVWEKRRLEAAGALAKIPTPPSDGSL